MIGNMNNAKVESGMLDSEYEPLVATPGAGFDVQTGGKWHKSFLGDPGRLGTAMGRELRPPVCGAAAATHAGLALFIRRRHCLMAPAVPTCSLRRRHWPLLRRSLVRSCHIYAAAARPAPAKCLAWGQAQLLRRMPLKPRRRCPCLVFGQTSQMLQEEGGGGG